MQIRRRIRTVRPESEFDKALEQELQSYSLDLAQIINKGLKFSDNFNAEIANVTDSGTANTEFSVDHTLKRIPTGYIVTYKNKAGIVYDSGTTWTTGHIYLKCSVANTTLKILIF